MQNKQIFKYVIFLFVLLLLFYSQVYISKQIEIDAYQNLITPIYIVNAILVIVLFIFIDVFKNKFKNQIGFIFMGSSFLKFLMFFIFIYPFFKSDGNLSKIEFITFFIPYFYCLLFESIVISNLLNRMKF